MGAGVISVGGVKYAAGLYWQPVAQRNIAGAAREAARDSGHETDYFAERPSDGAGRVGQFGLASREAGHRSGLPSIAASLANAQVGSWAGAFRVPEGTVIVVVRDDLVDPEGDQLYSDEAEAMARLDEEVARGGLQRMFAPVSWGLPGADEIALPLLLGKRRDGRLKPIKSKAPIYAAAAAAVAVLLIAGSYAYDQAMLYMDQQAADTRAAQRVRGGDARWASAEEAIQAQLDGVKLPPIPTPPDGTSGTGIVQALPGDKWPPPRRIWQDQMTAMTFLTTCHEMMQAMPAAVLGWTLVSVRCAPVQAVSSTSLSAERQAVVLDVLWNRSGGPGVPPPTVTFGEDAKAIFANSTLSSSVQESLQTASSSIPSNDQPARGAEEIWESAETTAYVLAKGWPTDALSMLPDDPPYIPPSKRDSKEKPPRAPWQKRGVQFSTLNPPWTMAPSLAPVPGLVIYSVDWQPGGQWQMKGAIYEQR